MIRRITTKDESKFVYFCANNIDKFNDFYITSDNQRYFLSDSKIAKKVFNTCLKHGDICYISEELGEINGVLLIVGISDKAPRKYMKILATEVGIIDNMLKYINWNYSKDIYAKLNNKNPLIETFKRNGFNFLGGRGSQILLARNSNGHNQKNYQKSFGRPDSERRS